MTQKNLQMNQGEALRLLRTNSVKETFEKNLEKTLPKHSHLIYFLSDVKAYNWGTIFPYAAWNQNTYEFAYVFWAFCFFFFI